MKTKIVLIALVLISLTFKGFAQKEMEKSADKKYEQFAYIDAIKTYERITTKRYTTNRIWYKPII